jgi:mRNA interferase RelE/StbE
LKILYEERFARDLKKIREEAIHSKVKEIIIEVSAASKMESVRNTKKLSGHEDCYRIRIGDYRLGLVVEDGAAIFVRFLHRKEIYRYFP